MTDTKAEQATAKAGSTEAGSAVPVAVAPKADAQPQAAQVEAQPRQGIGALRMAAVVTLAVVAGALGGVLAPMALTDPGSDDPANARLPSLEAAVARIESDIPTLRANAEYASEISLAKLNETNGRLDKLEKAQAEPAAKLARLSDAVDKLRTASLVAPTTAAAATVTPAVATAAPETTSSIAPPATPAAAPAAAPAAEVARLPIVQGWSLRGISNGIALIQGRRGIFEVYPGTIVPGIGRVDAVRRQDGRWVVVTAKGLIVGHWRSAPSPRREAIALPY